MGRHAAYSNASARWLPWLVALSVFVVVALVLVLVPGRDPDPQQAVSSSTAPVTTESSRRQPPTTTAPTTPTPAPPPTPAAEPTVTLAFAGDVHFTGRTRSLLDDPGTAFGPIAQTLAAADLAMVNLESAITERGREEPKQFHFRAPPVALDALTAAGIDVASLANNHAVDYGPVGLEDTLAAARSGRLPVVGVGPDAAAAYAPYRTSVRGVSLAFFGVSQVPDRTYNAWTATDGSPGIASTADQQRLIDGVRAASEAGDVTVVYVHWGIEGDACPTEDMRDLARALADAGADIVVGTHAHLLLGAGWLGAGPAYVAYGLGNFLWWRSQAFSDDTGVLTLTVQGGGVVAAEFTPALIQEDGRPQPVTGPSVADLVSAFGALRDCTTLRRAR